MSGLSLPGKLENLLPPPDESGFTVTRDGTSIYYEIRGEGRPLIFCYGLVCRIEHWRHQLKHFLKRYCLVTLDYRGHHRSALPDNDRHLTLEWCAFDIQDLMNHLGLSEAVCLGHSMGVPVAATLASLEPGRVKGSVLICGSMNNPFQQMFHSNRMDTIYRLSSQLYELAPDAMSSIWRRLTIKNRWNYLVTSRFGFNASLAAEQDVLSYMEGVHQTAFGVFQALLSDYVNLDGESLLKSVHCPILLVAGEEDCITPMDVQKKMASWAINGLLVTIPQGSHNAHTEIAHLVNKEIDLFLERLGYQ